MPSTNASLQAAEQTPSSNHSTDLQYSAGNRQLVAAQRGEHHYLHASLPSSSAWDQVSTLYHSIGVCETNDYFMPKLVGCREKLHSTVSGIAPDSSFWNTHLEAAILLTLTTAW